MKIAEMATSERPREKLLQKGKESLSTIEILAVILGSGIQRKSAMEVAMNLLSMNRNGISYLADCTPEELMAIDGIGEAKACELLAAVELGKRIATMPSPEGNYIASAQDIVDLFMERMRHYKKEHFVSVLIDSKGKVIEEVKVSIGDLNSSITHPREVFVEAVRRSAGSVIFVHNHPSGDPMPSEADIETTERLIKAGQLIGIPVLDHIIIGDGTYISMKANGYMEN